MEKTFVNDNHQAGIVLFVLVDLSDNLL